jgi:hypothetical protein
LKWKIDKKIEKVFVGNGWSKESGVNRKSFYFDLIECEGIGGEVLMK